MPNRSKRRLRAVLLTPLVLLSMGTITAVAAKTTAVQDSAHLHLLKAANDTLSETGQATGTLPGDVQITLKINGRTATSSFRITAHGGSIWGHASGSLKIGKGGYESFGGSLTVDGGNGSFKRASGHGGLYGTLNRANDAMAVQVSGTLRT